MAMDIYVPVETDVIHKTKADFSKNISQRVIHLVQYDKKLPVIDIELFTDGEPYVIPGSAEVYVLWGNNDNTYVRIKCMTNSARTHVYFKVEQEMCYLYGQVNPILELVVGDNRAGSSSIPVVVDRNPVQEYYVPAILPEGGIPLNALSKEGATTETYIGFDGTNIVWKEVSGGGGGGGGTVTSIQAGEGLSTAPDSSQSGGTITTSGSLYLVKSGVNEGTYTKVVVDKYGRVTAGYSLTDTDIPNLPASKITSGTLDTARIPNLPASKITSGVFDVARIPVLGYYIKPQAGIPLSDISLQGAATDKYLGYDGTNLVWKVVPAGTVTEIIAGDGLTTTQDSSTSGGSITSSGTLYLAITGVTAGTYMKVAVDKYGRVTAGYSLSDTDIPNLPASKITSGVFDVDRIPALGYYTKPQTGIPLTDISVQGANTDLYVGFDGTNVVWKSVSALPPYTPSDANKGLHVNSDGSGVEWKEDEAGSIIDVTELPTSDIRSDVFYRLNKYGKKIVREVPCTNEKFSSMIFNHELSIAEVEAIITRPEVFYNETIITLGGQTVTAYAYFITYNEDASYADNLTYSFAIIKIPDLYNLMFITNLSLITYIQHEQLVGTPMVLWCNNGDVLSQITSGMFSVTGWDNNIPSVINCWSFNSESSDPVGLFCNYYLTDLVYVSKHTQYCEIVNIYNDGDQTTSNVETLKQLTMAYDDRIMYLDQIESNPTVVANNMINGIWPYTQYDDNTLVCIMITKSPLKNNSNIYLGILPIYDHQGLIDQAMVIPIESFLEISSDITVDIKEIKESTLYQYSNGIWNNMSDDIFTYDLDLNVIVTVLLKYFIESMVPGLEMSIYEVPKYLYAVAMEDEMSGLIGYLMIVLALFLGPGSNQGIHIDYSADIFSFDKLFENFGQLMDTTSDKIFTDPDMQSLASGAVIISVMLGIFSPAQRNERSTNNQEAFGQVNIKVNRDALMDMELFLPQFIYSLNNNNEYDSFYDLLEAKSKDKTFKLRIYMSNDIYLKTFIHGSESSSFDQFYKVLIKFFKLNKPSVLEYKFRSSSNDSNVFEYELKAASILPKKMNSIANMDLKNLFLNPPSYKNILRFYRINKIYPSYSSYLGGFTVQSIYEFNFKAQQDYFDFNYSDGKLSIQPTFANNIASSIDSEFTTEYTLLSYFYRYRINYLSGPNTANVETTQQKYAEYFNMKYNNVYLVQNNIQNPKTGRWVSNPGLLSPTYLQPAYDFTYDNTKATVKFGYGERYDSVTEFNHDQIIVCADKFWENKWILLSDYVVTDAAGWSSSDRRSEGYLDINTESGGQGKPVSEQIIYYYFINYLLNNPNSVYYTTYGIQVYEVVLCNKGVNMTSRKSVNHEYSYIIYAANKTNLVNGLNQFIANQGYDSDPCLQNYVIIASDNNADGPYAGSVILKEYVKTYYYNPVCISQDTMITMGDKTYKRAGDIKVGDIIMTANGPDKVMWIDSMCKKTCLKTQVYTFSDGTVLKVAYDHRVYSLNDKKYKKLSKWKLGEKTITDSGNIVSLVKCELIDEPIVHCIIYTFKYNSQYANGLLTGNRLANIKNNFIRRTGAKLYYRLVLKKSNEKYGFKDNK